MALTNEQLEKMLGLNETNATPRIISFKIDGKEITCYASYSYFDAKSYVKSPVRSASGVIENLNSYATFLTPRLRVKFSFMPLETYRTIMKLIQSKNEFVVECYDIVWDKMKSWKAYFSTEDYPELFIYDLHTLGAIGYEIELQGTNADMDLISIVYHKNDGSGMTVADEDIYAGQEVVIGQNAESLKTRNGYQFQGWSTSANGTQRDYLDNTAYVVGDNLVLYAIWTPTNERTLSYNYGVGETYIDTTDNSPIYSKTIIQGSPIGTLPTTEAKTVKIGEETYNPYTFKGWYWTPQIVESSTPITSTTTYSVQGNATIYQIFEPNKYTITYLSNGGNYTPAKTEHAYGSIISPPNPPTQEGKVFNGWEIVGKNGNDITPVNFNFSTMPPYNITLRAKWR